MRKHDAGKGGYGRPPSDNRFKPGRSGNPSGRPKGARSLRSDFNKVLKKHVQIREGGKLRYARRQEVILLKHRAKALQGHTKSAAQLLAMWAKREFRDTPPLQSIVATNNDRAIVEDFLRQLLQNGKHCVSAIRSHRCEAVTHLLLLNVAIFIGWVGFR